MSQDISMHDVSDDINDMIKDNVESVGLTEKEKSYQAKPKAKPKVKAKQESKVNKTPKEIDDMSPAEVELALAEYRSELDASKLSKIDLIRLAAINAAMLNNGAKPGSSSPSLNSEQSVWKNVPQPKTMGNTDQSGCRNNVPDVVMFGDDLFKLMSKASSEIEGWMKSTKAMEVGRGCVVQVTTQQRNPDGSYSVAEALSFVPGVRLVENKDRDGIVTGRRLK